MFACLSSAEDTALVELVRPIQDDFPSAHLVLDFPLPRCSCRTEWVLLAFVRILSLTHGFVSGINNDGFQVRMDAGELALMLIAVLKVRWQDIQPI